MTVGFIRMTKKVFSLANCICLGWKLSIDGQLVIAKDVSMEKSKLF
jgi:hypothetical protein